MSARSIAVILSLLALTACGEDEPGRQDAGFPGTPPIDGGATGGASNGFTNGAGSNGFTNGGSTGVVNGGSTGVVNGGSTGVATGGSTGVVNGGSTGGSSGGSTGVATGGSTGGSSGGSTGGSTGSSSGGSSGASTGGSTTPPPPPPPTDTPTTCPDGAEPLAAGVKISKVSIYQAVEIPLVKTGAWVTSRNAQVVQNKKALVRIFINAPTGGAKALRGVMTLDNGGSIGYRNSSDVTLSAASADGTLNSTFNINVQAADIGPSTKVSFAVLDPSCPATKGTPADARFPAAGTQDLLADKINKIKIVIVPVLVNGGMMPDTSPAQLENLRKDIVANYPIPDADITVRAAGPVTSTTTVTAQQGGWSQALDAVCSARSKDAPSADTYYYGLMTPAATFRTYCSSGCVLGLASLITRVNASSQCGIGVGWLAAAGGEDYAATTFTHEEGHNHGRSHVACNGEAGTDASYPYKSPAASIGSWGWDSRTGTTLYDPAKQKDYMSYCSPTWTSDYTYKAVGVRSIAVNKTAAVELPAEHTWHGILVDGKDTRQWSFSTEYSPGEEYEPADVVDEDGVVIDTIEAVRVRFDHIDDSFKIFIPQRQPGWAGLVLSDGTKIDFDSVLPAPQI